MVKGEEKNGWSDIQRELLEEILRKLTLLDYLSCRRVCRSWRLTIDNAVATKGACAPAPQFPFLMSLPLNFKIGDPATLFDITQQDTSYVIPTRTWNRNFEFDSIFSVQGWLVFQKIYYTKNNQNYDLILFSNPLSGEEFELAPLPLSPHQADVSVSEISVKLTFSSSASDLSEILVVACATFLPRTFFTREPCMQQLAFCKVSDKSWTVIPKERHALPFHEFVIVDWKLYAINSYTSSSLTVFNLKDSKNIASESLEPMPIPKSTWEALGYYEGRLARDGDEILFVTRFKDHRSEECSRTTIAFRIFKLDMHGGGPKWIEVDDLGDRVMLIDCNGVQVISAKEINLHGGGNRVFFPVKSDLGVYALKDKSFRSLPLRSSVRVSRRRLWFSPSLW